MTCSTFALYTSSFTKDANKALAVAETPEGDAGAKKRSDFLIRFETNFNHWLRVRLVCLGALVALKAPSLRSTSTACSFTHPARTYHCCPLLFDLIVLSRRHSSANATVMQHGFYLLTCYFQFHLSYLIPCSCIVSLCCSGICSIPESLNRIYCAITRSKVPKKIPNIDTKCAKTQIIYFPSICNHMLQHRLSSSLPSNIHGTSCTSPNPSFTEGAS